MKNRGMTQTPILTTITFLPRFSTKLHGLCFNSDFSNYGQCRTPRHSTAITASRHIATVDTTCSHDCTM